jgi:hypothetical protein
MCTFLTHNLYLPGTRSVLELQPRRWQGQLHLLRLRLRRQGRKRSGQSRPLPEAAVPEAEEPGLGKADDAGPGGVVVGGKHGPGRQHFHSQRREHYFREFLPILDFKVSF